MIILSRVAYYVGSLNYAVTLLCVIDGDILLSLFAFTMTAYCWFVWLWARDRPLI